MRARAEAAGVQIHAGTGVQRVTRQAEEPTVHLVNGEEQAASAVVLAVAPHMVAQLLPNAPAPAPQPVQAACFDVALSHLPNPRGTFALGIEEPLYLSVHSATAKLTPAQKSGTNGPALVHMAKYLPVSNAQKGDMQKGDPEQDRQQLLRLLDRVQPGWRDVVVHERFLPRMTVTEALVTARDGGTAGRPSVQIAGQPNVYRAGDWVGDAGMLVDAAFASAERAAELALAAQPASHSIGENRPRALGVAPAGASAAA